MTLLSSLLILGLWGCPFFKMFFTSCLSSSTSPLLGFWHACLMAVMYSPLDDHPGTMVKLGPWASSCFWAFVKGVSDRFLTQHLVVDIVLKVLDELFNPFTLDVFERPLLVLERPLLVFEWPLVVHCFSHNFPNLGLWHFKTLLFLAFIILFINSTFFHGCLV